MPNHILYTKADLQWIDDCIQKLTEVKKELESRPQKERTSKYKNVIDYLNTMLTRFQNAKVRLNNRDTVSCTDPFDQHYDDPDWNDESLDRLWVEYQNADPNNLEKLY